MKLRTDVGMELRHLTWLAALLIAFGGLTTVGLRAGEVIWWGATVGNPPSISTAGVVAVAGARITNLVAVTAGENHGLALTSDGKVIGFGPNTSWQASDSTPVNPSQTMGMVRIGGEELSDVVAISAGWGHSLALKNDGTVVAWGDNTFGQATVPSGLSNVVAVAAGGRHSLALQKDGNLVEWGQRKLPVRLTNITAIACSIELGSDLAISSDGTVIQSSRYDMITSAPKEVSGIVAVAAGSSRYLALRRDGLVLEWTNGSGEAPLHEGLSNIVGIASGSSFNLALKKDGTIAAWGFIGRKPTIVPEGLSNVVAIAAGGDFGLAITTNSAVADKFRH